MSSYNGQPANKSRGVKPILRKLTQSEKNSLDLDRSATEQDGLGIYSYGAASRSSHDVAYPQPARRAYHNRSTSGTSQFSTATAGSAHRAGSFVHPFQQTPRPFTPPLAVSYQNSLRESEQPDSPALTEDEDHQRHTFRSPSNLSNHRTASLTTATSPNITQLPRIQTKPSSSRLALETSHASFIPNILSPDLISPTENMSPSSLRTSMDRGFRIRSRSDTPNVHIETVQEARRKFQERELAKEEKAAREEVRALEKRQQREAMRIERGHRRSSASDRTRAKRSRSDLTSLGEKGEPFIAREYSSTGQGQNPAAGGGETFDQPRRSGTAKRKTHSTWTKFMMWLRTRILRMSKKEGS